MIRMVGAVGAVAGEYLWEGHWRLLRTAFDRGTALQTTRQPCRNLSALELSKQREWKAAEKEMEREKGEEERLLYVAAALHPPLQEYPRCWREQALGEGGMDGDLQLP